MIMGICRMRGGVGTEIDVTFDLGLVEAGSMTLQEILFTISPSYLGYLFITIVLYHINIFKKNVKGRNQCKIWRFQIFGRIRGLMAFFIGLILQGTVFFFSR